MFKTLRVGEINKEGSIIRGDEAWGVPISRGRERRSSQERTLRRDVSEVRGKPGACNVLNPKRRKYSQDEGVTYANAVGWIQEDED